MILLSFDQWILEKQSQHCKLLKGSAFLAVCFTNKKLFKIIVKLDRFKARGRFVYNKEMRLRAYPITFLEYMYVLAL
jgi:hypothetical protein